MACIPLAVNSVAFLTLAEHGIYLAQDEVPVGHRID